MTKTIPRYDIELGVTEREYERWLLEGHVPDIRANPHVDKPVLNSVTGHLPAISGGSLSTSEGLSFYRFALMHFRARASYQVYRSWLAEHPIADECRPNGWARFGSYLVTEVIEVERGAPGLTPSLIQDAAS